MNRVFLVIVAALLVAGCSEKKNGNDEKPADMAADRAVDLPVDAVLDAEVDVVPDAAKEVIDIPAQELTVDVVPDLPDPEELAEEIVVPPDGIPFSEGPYGVTPFETAGPFVVPTLKGEWEFKKEWSFGKDNYMFISHSVGNAYVDELLSSSIKDLLKHSPANVHYFFMSVDSEAKKHVEEMQGLVQVVLDGMEDWEAVSWGERIHFITEPVHLLDNWLGDVGKSYTDYTFAIDRFQRFRETGLLKSIGGSEKIELRNLAYEIVYFNYEWKREQELAAQEEVTVVPLFEEEYFGHSNFVEVELPDEEAMAQFDTLEFDLTMGCPDKIDWNCGDWDYLAQLYICDVDDPEKCDTEIGRWITGYKRQGRWITDASSALAFFPKGGMQRFRYDASSQGYVMSIYFRLSNRDKGMRPTEQQFLWGGGGFGLGYNAGHPPIYFEVPDDVVKVELFAYITGHGFGGDWANCAEFCNHTHHFSVNGGGEHVKKHSLAGTATGCAAQVKDGVVPNQFGTWPFGRGGWCPGFDVKPFAADLTSDIIQGENEITYKALHKGVEFDPSGRGANIRMVSYLVYWR